MPAAAPRQDTTDHLVTDIADHAFLLLGMLAGTRLHAGHSLEQVRNDLLPIYKRLRETMSKLGKPVADPKYGTPFVQALFFEEPTQEND